MTEILKHLVNSPELSNEPFIRKLCALKGLAAAKQLTLTDDPLAVQYFSGYQSAISDVELLFIGANEY